MRIKKILWAFVIIIMLSGIILMMFAKLDMGCELVAREVRNAAVTYLQADLRLSNVTGNPLRGYMILGTNLTRDNAEMLKADFVFARINIMSLLSSPRLSLLSIGGVNMDLDKFIGEFDNLPSQPSDRPFEMPVDELRLVQSRFVSKWGEVGVEDIGLRFSDNTITARLKGHVNAIAVSGTLAAEIRGTQSALRNANLRIGKGVVKASGQLSEILDLQGTIEGIDLAELSLLLPAADPKDFAGTVNMSFKATGTLMDPVFSATTGFVGTRLAGLPVESFNGAVNYRQMRFSLDQATARVLGIPLTGNVAMAFRETVPTVFVQLNGGAADLGLLAGLGGVTGITGSISNFSAEIKGSADALSGIISLNAPSIGASGVTCTDAALQIRLSGGNEASISGRMNFQGAPSSVTGTASELLSGPKLDLIFNTADLNVAGLTPLIPEAEKFDPRGYVTAAIRIRGAMSDPSLDGTLRSESFSASGYTADNISMEFSYAQGIFALRDGSAYLSGLPVRASGNFRPSNGAGQFDVMISGLDLAKLTESIPELAGQVGGILSVRVNAALSADGISGQGNASAPSVRIFGLRLADASVPIALDGVNFRFGQGSASLNGGTLSFDGNVNTQTMQYSGRLSASGVDVNALIHDLIPDLDGNITGRGTMDMSFSGASAPEFALEGTGRAIVGSGGVSGFKWLDLASRLYGADSIRYTEITAPFRLETNRLILLNGSAALAPEGDPLYRYVYAEGPITYAGDLNLTGEGNVNFQLFNAAAGGVMGAVGAVAGGNISDIFSGRGLEDILKQTLDGGSAGSRQTDFREVSFRIDGNAEKPSFSIVRAGPPNLVTLPGAPEPQNQQQNIGNVITDIIGIPLSPADTSEQLPVSGTGQPRQEIEEVVREEAGRFLRNLLR